MSADLFQQVTGHLDGAKQPEKEKPKEVTKAETKATTNVVVKAQGKETEIKSEQKVIKEDLLEEQQARLWVDYGVTVNLGNYESAKISIGLSLPVGKKISPELEKNIRATQMDGMAILDSLMEKEVAALRAFATKKKAAESGGSIFS